MTTPNRPKTDHEGPHKLDALVQGLLAEPYAGTEGLGELTLEALGAHLEEVASDMELDAESDTAKSFERCRDLYCSILLEMEAQAISPPAGMEIGNLAGKSSPSAEEDPAIKLVEAWEGAETTDTGISIIDTSAESPVIELEPEEAGGGISADASLSIEVPEVEAPSVDIGVTPEPPLKTETTGSIAESPGQEISIEDPSLEAGTAEPTAPSIDLPEDNEETVIDVMASARQQRHLRLAPEPPPAPTAAEPPPPPVQGEESHAVIEEVVVLTETVPVIGEKAREFLEIARFFQGTADRSDLPRHHSKRLFAQSMCHAVEMEVSHRLKHAITAFWSARKELIPTLFTAEKGHVTLADPVRRWIDMLAVEHGDWLPDGRFPHAAVIHSLRFMLAVDKPESFTPSLVDGGMLLLLFGEEVTLEPISLKNHLHLTGIGGAELVELSFRLFHLQKLRNASLSLSLSPEEAESLADNVDREAKAAMALALKLAPAAH